MGRNEDAATAEAATGESGDTDQAAVSALSGSSASLGLEPPPGSVQAIAWNMLPDHGWDQTNYSSLDLLWTRVSGWSYTAENPSSGAYGIPQALPGSQMASAGPDWRTNPETQIKWGLDYIASRYGDPNAAWVFWQVHGDY